MQINSNSLGMLARKTHSKPIDMSDIVASAVLSCLFAALAASLATWLVETRGGIFGGIVASSPTTIVTFALGMAWARPEPDIVAHALYAVPSGMLCNGLFLLLWRLLPDTACYKANLSVRHINQQLLAMAAMTLGAWVVRLCCCLPLPSSIPSQSTLVFFSSACPLARSSVLPS